MTRLVSFLFVILILKLSSSKPTRNNDYGKQKHLLSLKALLWLQNFISWLPIYDSDLDPELKRVPKLEERRYPATMLSQRLPEPLIKHHLGTDFFKRFTRDTQDFLYKRILKRALQSKYQELRTTFEDY